MGQHHGQGLHDQGPGYGRGSAEKQMSSFYPEKWLMTVSKQLSRWFETAEAAIKSMVESVG